MCCVVMLSCFRAPLCGEIISVSIDFNHGHTDYFSSQGRTEARQLHNTTSCHTSNTNTNLTRVLLVALSTLYSAFHVLCVVSCVLCLVCFVFCVVSCLVSSVLCLVSYVSRCAFHQGISFYTHRIQEIEKFDLQSVL